MNREEIYIRNDIKSDQIPSSVLLNISASTQVVNWYPKKSGPPATVTKNESHTGLHLLWQKHLQQVSKRVGIEQAKVIASDPDFQSPHRLFETYRQAFSPLNQS